MRISRAVVVHNNRLSQSSADMRKYRDIFGMQNSKAIVPKGVSKSENDDGERTVYIDRDTERSYGQSRS